MGALLTSAEPKFRAFIALAAFAGLRLGEAAALKVSDINFLGRTLEVARQVQRERGGGVEIRPPKYGSERTVYLADGLVKILAKHIEDFRPGGDLGRWLFEGEDGQPAAPEHRGLLVAADPEGGRDQGLKLHDLRHFYASGLIASGCDVVTVQRALGHSKATTTLNTYSHLWPTAEDRTRNAAAALLSETLSQESADSMRTAEGG
ncbi:site-specific integrase [Nonomuraea sp. 3N208]|uniref:site-specific integrase n=1 Tax=Nonomuraea sp. 3N208 TaxID=3457421 RepID=UPI003FCD1984